MSSILFVRWPRQPTFRLQSSDPIHLSSSSIAQSANQTVHGGAARQLGSSFALEMKLHPLVEEKFKGFGFENLFKFSVSSIHHKSLLHALVDAYEVSSGTFRLGETFLYFRLEDVLLITTLPFDGEPVCYPEKIKDYDFQEVLGLPYTKYEKGFMLSQLVHVGNKFIDYYRNHISLEDYNFKKRLKQAC